MPYKQRGRTLKRQKRRVENIRKYPDSVIESHNLIKLPSDVNQEKETIKGYENRQVTIQTELYRAILLSTRIVQSDSFR